MNSNSQNEKEKQISEVENKAQNLSKVGDSPLMKFRNQLDEIDKNIIRLLSERYSITDLVGLYKKEHQIDVLDSERENRLLERIKSLAMENEVLASQEDLNFLVDLYEAIMRHSRQRQGNNR